MTWKSVQICDACWGKQNPRRSPILLKEEYRKTTSCQDCGNQTASGIYVKRQVPETAN